MGKQRRVKPNSLQRAVRSVIRGIFNRVNHEKADLVVSPPRQGSEAWYRDRLARQLGGQVEVHTTSGRIDILTSTEVIEVKEASGWKHAIGQVTVYGHHYPNHALRIHLFGEIKESELHHIDRICKLKNIRLTWE